MEMQLSYFSNLGQVHLKESILSLQFLVLILQRSILVTKLR